MYVYEALSYVWGDSSITRTILLEGREFQVTTNLYSALRRLRYPDYTRIIWIDAICINQSNLEERSQQVLLMKNIYEGAEEVLMWMGDSEERFHEPVCIIDCRWKRILNGNVSRRTNDADISGDEVLAAFRLISMITTSTQPSDISCGEPGLDSNSTIAPHFIKGFQAIRRLIQFQYWTRIWVFQKITFARSATLIWGHVSAPWDMFVLCAAKLGGKSFVHHFPSLRPFLRPVTDDFFL